jgi:hypothetical protein
MSRVTAVRREDVPELEDVFNRAERALGFVPNSFFAMARKPGILRAFSMLSRESLEERPLAFGESTLASGGWRPGKNLRK